jgi:hypothetical protein
MEYLFEQTAVYRFIFEWGSTGVEAEEGLYDSNGEHLWIWLNMAVCLYVSAWLLDRKVEV